ncbi:hypothetical protein HTZ78_12070 [Synechocystis sp. PCC 7338]|jgi:hypothetical protein|nr:hypothetical protein HTZ78_12070 [Synechocystis sp. PCC 7338]
MSLVICPECSQKVSSSAEACPNCGYAVARNFYKLPKKSRNLIKFVNSPLKIVMFGLMILLIFGSFANPPLILIAIVPGILWLLLNVDTWFQKN